MTKKAIIFLRIGIAICFAIILSCSCCTVVDNSEVGIKFKKFSVTEQGKLKTTPVSGFTFYNPITTSVYTYPVFIQRVDYESFANADLAKDLSSEIESVEK